MAQKLGTVGVIIAELKSEDIQLRLNSIRNLTTIAKSLGPERTRNELLAFLKEILEDEDEVLLALSEELGKLVPFLGGNEHAYVLLEPLETLSKIEETLVRDKAVDSLTKVIPFMTDDNFEEHCVGLIKRMISGEWFTGKSSACGLFHVIYPRVSLPAQAELRIIIKSLSEEETPMVRRSACLHLKKVIPSIDKESLKKEIIDIFKAFSKDEQETVRLQSVENGVALATQLSEEDNQQHIKPVILACAADKSWRVRFMVASTFIDLVNAFGSDITQTDMIPLYIKLLKDSEAEVRLTAVSKLAGLTKIVGNECVSKLVLPTIKGLLIDESQNVRASLASDIMDLAVVFGKTSSTEYLMDFILQLLKDEVSEVRHNIISKLNLITPILGKEEISVHILPAIIELAEDRQWRVRLAIVQFVPDLALHLGEENFNDKIGALCMNFIGDCVYSIREAASVNLQYLTKNFGGDWFVKNILPKIVEISKSTNYLYRVTSLFTISSLVNILDAKITSEHLLPIALQLVNDKVANIRLNVAKTLKALIQGKVIESGVLETSVKTSLTVLAEDKDMDVRYFANAGLQAIN